MRRAMESLNMFLLDYLIVPIWAVFSIMGNINSARIMAAVTIIFVIANYLSTRNSTKLFLLDINLAAACVAGIILNTFLFIRFVYADPQIITNMVTIIFLYTLGIIFACIICLVIKVVIHKRNMRIISRMASEDYVTDYGEDEEADEEDDDIDDDDEYYDEEESEEEERRGFLSSIPAFLSRGEDEDEEDEEDEEEDETEEDDGYEKPDGPKFRVVKK